MTDRDFDFFDLPYLRYILVGSNASAGAWDEAVRLAVSGAVPLAGLVSKRYPPDQAAEAFASARTSREVVKNLIDWRMST